MYDKNGRENKYHQSDDGEAIDHLDDRVPNGLREVLLWWLRRLFVVNVIVREFLWRPFQMQSINSQRGTGNRGTCLDATCLRRVRMKN